MNDTGISLTQPPNCARRRHHLRAHLLQRLRSHKKGETRYREWCDPDCCTPRSRSFKGLTCIACEPGPERLQLRIDPVEEKVKRLSSSPKPGIGSISMNAAGRMMVAVIGCVWIRLYPGNTKIDATHLEQMAAKRLDRPGR